MHVIKDQEFAGERPLFALHDAELDDVVINPGESSLKHVKHLLVKHSRFNKTRGIPYSMRSIG